jgi:hypothetical protein
MVWMMIIILIVEYLSILASLFLGEFSLPSDASIWTGGILLHHRLSFLMLLHYPHCIWNPNLDEEHKEDSEQSADQAATCSVNVGMLELIYIRRDLPWPWVRMISSSMAMMERKRSMFAFLNLVGNRL